MQYSDYTDVDLMALAIYREARGEGDMGRRGVGWVIKNRADNHGWYATPNFDVRSVILKPYQFSSFNANDPNSNLVPNPLDHTWLNCRLIASCILNGRDADLTNGADYYHDVSVSFPATWGNREDFKKTLAVGRLIFYRFAPMLSNHDAVSDAALGSN